MLGTFQQTSLRIEVDAPATAIRDSILRPEQLQEWLWPQRTREKLPEQLYEGLSYTSAIGPVLIHHRIDRAEPHCLRVLLSQGIDGFHEWYWGEGWVQSRLEGVSLLPLSLSHTVNLLRLREFLSHKNRQHAE
ncbi:hypothetical protein [Phormidium sp. CCY1219]|uniref:hypothetical protein n=1 Tax=Phormidium sp. CCY1219 TaxID=2886104 RepID=UPI002D1F4736|nr:hypothetical protein [Phormidium sp. CCY1219]MEB3830447.1 hypothetical protein [Phormidium sp. CCY1219]